MRLCLLTATSMKMSVFWDAAPRSLVKIDILEVLACLHHKGEDGGSKHL
jgi:hypothetical protein